MSNPIVRAFCEKDALDIRSLGDVGTLSGNAEKYCEIWSIVDGSGVTIDDIEKNWTYDMVMSFSSFRRMKNDFRSAWSEYYKKKAERSKQSRTRNGK